MRARQYDHQHRTLLWFLIAASSVVLPGCAALGLQAPPPAPGMQREEIFQESGSCRSGICTSELAIGEHRLAVQSETRMVSPEEATGRRPRSPARQAIGALGSAVLRGIGMETSHTMVGVGTRTVIDTREILDLSCDVAWIEEETRDEERGEEHSTFETLASGGSCVAAPPDDTTVQRWRFRWGISPMPDSLAVVLAMPSIKLGDRLEGEITMTLQRVSASDPAVVLPYTVGRDPAARRNLLGVSRWVVQRPDGSPVGAIIDGPVNLGAAVDVHESADEEEATMLRLIKVVLAQPLTET